MIHNFKSQNKMSCSVCSLITVSFRDESNEALREPFSPSTDFSKHALLLTIITCQQFNTLGLRVPLSAITLRRADNFLRKSSI